MRRDSFKGLEQEREPRDETNAIVCGLLEAVWNRPDVALREKTLQWMLCDTAARANGIFAHISEELRLGHNERSWSARAVTVLS